MGLYRRKKVNKIFFITLTLYCINGAYFKTTANNTIEKKELISISEAKIDRGSNYIPDRIGDIIKVSGRISVAPGVLWNDKFQMVNQDRTAGIFIFSFENEWPKLNFADSIEATGINQYRGLSQIIEPTIHFIDTVHRKIVKSRLIDGNNLEANNS